METIRKTVESKYAPKQTNVIWVDTSGDTPVEKHFIKGKWREMSGGGSAGSTNPTKADATKVWQVTPVQKGTETIIETVEIFPEQELWTSSTVHNTQNVDKFNVGNVAIVTINGVTYTSEIQDDDGSSQVVIVTNPDDETLSNTFYITNREGSIDFDFNNNIPPRPTVASLSVECRQETPIYDYNWAPGVKIPIPTAEDEGKILVVTKTEGDSKEYELAPTQTVTITQEEGDVILQNTSNLDKFVEGATVVLVLNGTTYNGHVINDGGLYCQIDDVYRSWFLDLIENEGGATLIFGGDVGTYEISASILAKEYSYEYQLQENSGSGSSNILYCEGSVSKGTVTAYIDSSELDNPQITTIAVDTGEKTSYFYRMTSNNWLVSGFSSFEDRNEWVKEWNTEGQYPIINAYFFNK